MNNLIAGRYYWVRFKKFVRNEPIKGEMYANQIFESDPEAEVTIGIYNESKMKDNKYPWQVIGSDEIYEENKIEVIRPVTDNLEDENKKVKKNE